MSLMKGQILVRSLSTSSASAQLVKPPVQVFGLEGRYASALYSAASKKKTLDAVEKELVQFQKATTTDAKLKEFIVNPTLKRSLKVDALKHLATKTNMSATTSNLLGLLAENGRLLKLDGVINAFKIMMSAHRGEVTCEVITAKPLDQAQKQNLEAALKGCRQSIIQPSDEYEFEKYNFTVTTGICNAYVKFMKGNETIQLTAKVDPSIMGGMIVSIADKYVDMSVASKVKKYTELISAAV